MADTVLTGPQVVQKCETLRRLWDNKRIDKMKEWYRLIQMEDELAQKNMESFVGNDPRASFNLILGMLEQKVPHRIPSEELTEETVTAASDVATIFDAAWNDVFARYRRRGKYWLRDFLSFLLATGWYSVFATMSMDGSRCIAEIWHPAQVYQNWDDELVECAHIFTAQPLTLSRMVARAGWDIKAPTIKSTVYDYWRLDDCGRVYNSVVLGTGLAKPETFEPRFKRIPIFTAPVGGLPDTGLLSLDSEQYKQELGQSVVATNENIYRSWNKWWTFSTQLLRDTAQPRWLEQSSSGTRIVKPEEVFKYGAVFKMGVQDKFGPIQMPPIPVELRAAQLDMEAMMGRGGPNPAMYGQGAQGMTQYVMSQITASVRNIAKPFHDGTIDMFTDIDNFWLGMCRDLGYKPYGKSIPKELPKDARLTADYEIRIPGDIIQRATAARMLDSEFQISPIRVMQELFPEIKNPIEEMAAVRAAKAERHPVRALIALIESFRQEADLLTKQGDVEGARLYGIAADRAEAMLGMAEEEEAPPARTTPGARPEAIPPPSPSPPAV